MSNRYVPQNIKTVDMFPKTSNTLKTVGMFSRTQISRMSTRTRLSDWHQGTVKQLNINPEDGRRKRDGFNGVIRFIP